jgi:hypothetical protein
MAHLEGFEPPTTKFVAWCSIQLSYKCVAPEKARIVLDRRVPVNQPLPSGPVAKRPTAVANGAPAEPAKPKDFPCVT